MQLAFGRKDGKPVMQGSMTEVMDPLQIARLIKAQFPEVWAQVNLEIVVAQEPPKVNGHNRIFMEGAHGGD